MYIAVWLGKHIDTNNDRLSNGFRSMEENFPSWRDTTKQSTDDKDNKVALAVLFDDIEDAKNVDKMRFHGYLVRPHLMFIGQAHALSELAPMFPDEYKRSLGKKLSAWISSRSS